MPSLPVYAVRLVREGRIGYDGSRERPTVRVPADAARILQTLIGDHDREAFAVLLLDNKHRITAGHIAHLGALSECRVTAREVFKAAVLANAAAVILGHNHPSGEPEPSADDQRITAKLQEAGRILGVEVLDHVVIVGDGRFVSLRERGAFSA